MTIDLDYYLKIQNMYNETDIKNAEKYELKQLLDSDFNKPLDCYSVLVEGKSQDLTIIKTKDLKIKKVKTRPNENLYVGQLVEWSNSHWLVTEIDADNDLFTRGKIEECNYLLKWQNKKGQIIEKWAIIKGNNSNGVEENKTIRIGSDELSVTVSVDEETIGIKKSIGKKFFIDNNKDFPTAYELTSTGNVVNTYRGYGVTSWMVKETPYSPTSDDLESGVCEYFNVTGDEDEEETLEGFKMVISHTNSKNIIIGGNSKTLVSQLFMISEEDIPLENRTYIWSVLSEYPEYVNCEISDNIIKIKVTNETDNPFSITVSVRDKETETEANIILQARWAV